MIIVSEKSWHYRFLRWMKIDIPSNLCPYLRCVLLWAPAGLIGSIFVSLIVLFLFLVPVLIWYGIINGWNAYPFTFLSMAVYTVIGIATLQNAKYIPFGQQVLISKRKLERPQSLQLLQDYFDAIHDKVCPRVEFKNDVQ